MAEDSPPTLYQWAGERPGLERLINAFYDRVEGDDPERKQRELLLDVGVHPGEFISARLPRRGYGRRAVSRRL